MQRVSVPPLTRAAVVSVQIAAALSLYVANGGIGSHDLLL